MQNTKKLYFSPLAHKLRKLITKIPKGETINLTDWAGKTKAKLKPSSELHNPLGVADLAHKLCLEQLRHDWKDFNQFDKFKDYGDIPQTQDAIALSLNCYANFPKPEFSTALGQLAYLSEIADMPIAEGFLEARYTQLKIEFEMVEKHYAITFDDLLNLERFLNHAYSQGMTPDEQLALELIEMAKTSPATALYLYLLYTDLKYTKKPCNFDAYNDMVITLRQNEITQQD